MASFVDASLLSRTLVSVCWQYGQCIKPLGAAH
jgi:hypothetical protein